MENSNKSGIFFIFIMIGALLVAFFGILSIVLGMLGGADLPSIIGVKPTYSSNNENQQIQQYAPLAIETNAQFDYGFFIPYKTFNANSVVARAESLSRYDQNVAGISTNNQIELPKQQEVVVSGIRDNLVTTEIKAYAETVKSTPHPLATGISRIVIDSININSPVIQGSDGDAALDQGMWLYPTSYAKGEKILLCHRRYFGPNDPRSCWFIDRAKVGDVIRLESDNGQSYEYSIVAQAVREGDDMAIFNAADDDLVKIITCTPLGSSSHRLITIGKRI